MASSPELRLSPARVRHTLRTLILGSVICTAMLLVRFAVAGDLRFRFSGLLGNLLLAWIPLVLALYLPRLHRGRPVWFWSALVAWVLFFPNAYYITTDLIHVKKFGTDGMYRWYDMLMTASFAFAGIFLGSLSLYLMQLFVRAKHGWRIGWAFACTMLALGSFGIYLGRFLRLNSWDVLTRPIKLVRDIASLLAPMRLAETAAFSVTFFLFSLGIYAFVVSLARLHEEDPAP